MTIEVKICGLSTAETMEAALGAGAEHVGLVVFPPSPRHVEPARAAELAAQARGRARVVVLTVDADDVLIDRIMAEVKPDVLQLHGSETPERIAAIRRRHAVEIWKALPVGEAADVARADAYAEVVDRIVFDARPPKGATRPGGNAVSFDWGLLTGLDLRKPFVLSGGLDAVNVGTALAVTRAPAVDVSSGVESAPGIKDIEKIGAFTRAARAAARVEEMAGQ